MPWAKFFVDSMMFIVFVTIIGLVVMDGIKDGFSSKEKVRDRRLKEALGDEKVKLNWVDHLVNWSIIPHFF